MTLLYVFLAAVLILVLAFGRLLNRELRRQAVLRNQLLVRYLDAIIDLDASPLLLDAKVHGLVKLARGTKRDLSGLV